MEKKPFPIVMDNSEMWYTEVAECSHNMMDLGYFSPPYPVLRLTVRLTWPCLAACCMSCTTS